MLLGMRSFAAALQIEIYWVYTNGFKPGSEVQLTIYKNINGATRATYWCTSNKDYTNRLISEIKNTNIISVKNWKILSTIAVPRGTPEKNIKIHKNYAAKFKNIVIYLIGVIIVGRSL
ncbi:YrpD family protein [Photorhabdus asymbiotica]|uniref:YrpD family protein n=2 Tax=Morganellaceae TaxID=1903414 RepID=UPI000EADD714